jgi:hypothetical protein
LWIIAKLATSQNWKKKCYPRFRASFFLGEKFAPKKEKIRNIGIFANLKSPKSERSREKRKPRKI